MNPQPERGAAAVEFALILLPFMLLVSLLVDVGWVFGQQQAVTNSAREGAREYAINHLEDGSEDDAVARATAVATSLGVATPITVSVSECGDDEETTVVVTAPMTNITGLIPAIGGGKTIEGRATMRCGG